MSYSPTKFELPTTYQGYIHISRYSRWIPDLGRRETFDETVRRYPGFFVPYLNENHDAGISVSEAAYYEEMIGNMGSMPSMRCFMTAGPALARDHIAGYNCAYAPVDRIEAFSEALYIMMCGTGVGFSVERQYVNKLPVIPQILRDSDEVVVVEDSKEGWAHAFHRLLVCLYDGRIPRRDTSRIRKKGTRLTTMGGRASGPEPFERLWDFTVETFKKARGRHLESTECHDLMCMTGEIVVVGGVRRSSLISLSNPSDLRMRDAKAGNWYELTPWRKMANNSAAFTEKPETDHLIEMWLALHRSRSGERGIFNRVAAREQVLSTGRRKAYWDQPNDDVYDPDNMRAYLKAHGRSPIDFGTNPCGEIILRPEQFCNLSTIVARAGDDFAQLEKKARAAAAFGTWQSALTNFKFIGSRWKQNCDEERLLGVSITGIMDCPVINGTRSKAETKEAFEELRYIVNQENAEWADRLDIPRSRATTCVKPEGTASKLVLSGEGVHVWHAPFYLNNVRNDRKDPLTDFLIDMGVPHEVDVMNNEAMVFSFPVRAPKGALTQQDQTAVEALDHWLLVKKHWCEHNPSCTITLDEHEWTDALSWVDRNWNDIGGLSFMPKFNSVYPQLPKQTVTEAELVEVEAAMPKIDDWTELSRFENDDEFVADGREMACVAGQCTIV